MPIVISKELIIASPPARNAPAGLLGLLLFLDPVVERWIIDHFVTTNVEQNWLRRNWAQFWRKVNFAVLFAKVSNLTLEKGTLHCIFRFQLTEMIRAMIYK